MRIAIFGLGYVGVVSAACLAARRHDVLAVDVEPLKVRAINAGRSPIVEPGLDRLVADVVASRHLRAATSAREAISQGEVSFVCVGTPGRQDGSANTDNVERVVAEIAAALHETSVYHVIVIRSTVPPGTLEDRLVPIVERITGDRPGKRYGICSNPEFLREGSSIADFYEPAKIIIGELDGRSGDDVARVYEGIDAPVVRTTPRTAEMIKYADNAFHTAKIGFANEIGNICKAEGIDGREVMRAIRLDTKLNISEAYLKPGAAFGGACLPKDLRALAHHAGTRNLQVPLLASILASNEQQKRIALEMVRQTGKRRVGILGLSFKPGTDDLRESPAVELVESLITDGYDVSIYDRNVSFVRLLGANRAYADWRIPHLGSLMKDRLDDVIAASEVLVLATLDSEFEVAVREQSKDRVVIDLAGVVSARSGSSYKGICW